MLCNTIRLKNAILVLSLNLIYSDFNIVLHKNIVHPCKKSYSYESK